ncbi:glycoside hydrolase domain-containing protein [Paenibacillus oryzisoli]|uniref:DUF4091 domain-containing protein n=1 Tax=Paenibacillus oryzisoli TaxID=1850517 RepID=UPI003D296B88
MQSKRWLIDGIGMKTFADGAAFAKWGDAPAFRVFAADGMAKIRRDQPLEVQSAPRLQLEAARNEYEGAQLVVIAGDSPLRKLQVSVSELRQAEGPAKIDKSRIQLYKEHYIEVTKPTTSAYPAGWYPDALLPMDGHLTVDAGNNQAIYIKVHIPKGQPAGMYAGEVTLQETGEAVRIPVTLQVFDFELTDESHTETAFALWSEYLAEAEHIAGDDAWEMIEKYYWASLEHRLTPSDLPIPTDSPERYVEQAVPYLTNPKVSAVRLPAYRNADGTYDEAKMEIVVDALREKGLLGKTYYYITEIDEPAAATYPRVTEIAVMLNRIAPDVRHFVTTQPVDELTDSVHDWVAQIDKYDEPFARKLQAGGDHVWWYTCVVPKHPFPTYHLDDDLLGSRLLSWLQKDCGVEGTLYWATTIFQKYDGKAYGTRDVWTDPLAFPGANGDGYLFYPGYEMGIDGPVGTLRLENLREGAEDYEYLWTLEQRLQEQAAKLGAIGFDVHDALQPYYDRLYTNIRDYNADTSNLSRVRREVAESIQSLGRAGGIQSLIGVKKLSAHQREITIYTEKGAAVSVEGTTLTPMEESVLSVRYVVTLTLAPGLTEVSVQLGKHGKTETRSLTLKAEEPLSYEIPLMTGENMTDLNRWTVSNVALSWCSSRVTEAGCALQAEFQAGANFPNIRLFKEETGFRSSDWSNYGALSFDVHNLNEKRTAIFYVKFHDLNGRTDDSFFQSVQAGCSRTVRIPLKEVGIDLTHVKGIELWMFKQPESLTLGLDYFHFDSKAPETTEPWRWMESDGERMEERR